MYTLYVIYNVTVYNMYNIYMCVAFGKHKQTNLCGTVLGAQDYKT